MGGTSRGVIFILSIMSLQLLTIQHWLKKHATYRPQHPAIIFEDKQLTYGQLYEEVNRLCNAFVAAGIGKGDKVATLLSNSLELWETYWACAAIGAIAVPLSPLLRGDGLFNLLNNSDTKLVITSQNLTEHIDAVRKKLNNIPAENFWITDSVEDGFQNYHTKKQQQLPQPPQTTDVFGDDAYNIIYSSGTTGLPKGIVISHAVRALYGSLFANAFRMTPESVVMHSGSIIFNGSFLTLMPAMLLGCTYVLMSHFDANEVVDIIYKEKVTHTILVPSQIIGCLQKSIFNKAHLSSLEYILSVGAPLLLEHKQELNKRMPKVFYELYGLTEGFMTILDKNDVMKKTGSVGMAPQFMEMQIVEDKGTGKDFVPLKAGQIGEIIGRGPLLMTEYYKNREQTNEALKDGWLFTGDLGYVDADGFLFLTGRKKDLIISGGVNVYPSDIEEVIIRHPAVKDVAVFGVPHEEWGETPVAAVVLQECISATAAEIKSWSNQKLEARYQKIYEVIIMKELPRNVAGKILKRELRDNFAGNFNAEKDNTIKCIKSKDYFIKTNTINLHYLEYEGEQPTIIFMHGLTANAHAFDGLMAAGLNPAFHIISVDLRGRGESDAPDVGYTMKEHATDIIALMDALKLNKVILAGHSFGGFLALYLVKYFPDRVDKLILMDAAANMHPNTKDMLAPTLGRLGQTFSSFNAYLEKVKSAAYLTFWDKNMETYYKADVKQHADGSVSCIPQSAHMMEAVLKGSLGEPWMDYLQTLEHETILINAPGVYTLGAALLPEENAMETVELMKNCIYAKVQGNHQTMLYGPGAGEIVSIIKHFLNK